MGCNCGSKAAGQLRAQILTQPVVTQQVVAPTPVNDAARKQAQQEALAQRETPRKSMDKTLCPLCKGEITYRLEHIRNQWVKVKWCGHCGVRVNVL